MNSSPTLPFPPDPNSVENRRFNRNVQNDRKRKMLGSKFMLRTLIQSHHLLPLAFFLFTFCFLPCSVASDEETTYDWEPDGYPNLNKNPKYCTGFVRNPPTAICDPDGILSKQEALELDNMIADQKNATSCLCDTCPPNKKGLSIKVAILLSVKKRKNQTLDETIEQFADRTRSNWNFSPACQHDLIIFVSTSYNKVHFSMGNKAERVIGSSDAKEIIKDTLNHFKYGHVYQGLESIIASVKYREQVYDPRFDRLGLKQGLLVVIGAALLSLIVIIIAVWFCIKRETRRTGKALSGATTTDADYHPVKTNAA